MSGATHARRVSLAAVALAGVCASLPLAAQPAGAQAEAPSIPRAADGRPDLSGIWIAGGALMLYAGEDAAAAARASDAAIGRAPNPPPTPPPYKPEAEAKRQEYLARLGVDDPMARCLLTGVPRIQFRPLPFEIIQLPDRIVILYEIHHAFRIIATDGRGHPDDLEPTYLGDSVAHWEDDTLVVDVTGFNTGTWLQGVGTIHSEQLRVTERYTRDTFDTIRYEATMEDPEVFTKPWTIHETLRLRPGERIREYECIESNEDILRFEKLLEDGASFIAP
jgi:hypothetical protein